ncbi:DUF4838 domain-containing protein [Sphingobacterium sp.]|uniref:DUF4838 domain-containing protein n=1 Tax=Sphingobacterium sp. TaxID=341027 RepID=UPI002896454A|nr:DUF4838 domain-containing protein [Sphingobacterium sp.]
MKIVKKQIRLLLFVFVLLLNSCSANELKIVLEKKSRTEIVIPVEPSSLERKSAFILQDYLKRMTGVTVDILSTPSGTKAHVFFIGNSLFNSAVSNAAPLGREGFEVRVQGENIYLRGGSGKGLLYGVYELIEKQFGARKYDQGAAWVLQRENLTLPKDLLMRFEPPLIYRESYYPSSMDAEYLDWHHLHRFEDLWGLWGHSFFKIIPPDRYFTAHPEYFAWTNGRRQASQLCLTNPEVEKIAIGYFKDVIADNPDAMYWSIAPMDGQGYCTCDRCAKVDQEEGGPQGTLVRFVNRVASHFPKQIFTTLAYGYTAEAPKRTKPRENVYVMLSTIDVTRQQAIATNPSAADFRRQLQQWSKLTANLFVWDYTTQFTAYLNPFPMYDQYHDNIAYMYRNGIKGIFEHGSGTTLSDMSAYASYLQAKSLWNPTIDPNRVSKDFFEGYYGSASRAVQRYVEQLIEARKTHHAVLDIYGNPITDRKGYLNEKEMSGYRKTLNAARAEVAHDPLLANRVNTLLLGWEYATLEQAKTYGSHPLGFLKQVSEGKWQVDPMWAGRIDHFVDDVLKAGGRELAEVNGSLEEYRNRWLDIMRRPYGGSAILGKIPTFKPRYLEDYVANGDRTLSDGLFGDTDYSYNWLLFNDGHVELVFPLQGEQTASRVKLNFLFDPVHYLFLPKEIQVEASVDGKIYQDIGMQRVAENIPTDNSAKVHTVSIALSQKKMRYLRVQIRFPKDLPDWFEGARRRKPLLAIDEVSME